MAIYMFIYLGKLQYFTNQNQGHLGMISLTNHDSRARSQWGRYNLPRFMSLYPGAQASSLAAVAAEAESEAQPLPPVPLMPGETMTGSHPT